MFPNTSSLTLIPDRPSSLVCTGRISHSGKWMVTEFRGKGDTIYYKHERLRLGRKEGVYDALWYKE